MVLIFYTKAITNYSYDIIINEQYVIEVIPMDKLFAKVKKYKNLSISFKLLASTAFLILFSVFLVSFLSYIQYTRDFKEQSANKVQQIIEQASLNIDTYMDDLFRLSVSPFYYDNIIDSLEQNLKHSEMLQLDKTRFIEGFLDQMMIIPRNDILRVMILSDDVYMSERIRTGIDASTDFHNFDWYKKAIVTRGPVFVPAHLEQIVKYPKHTVFSVVNVLRSTRNTEKILGVIKVDANFSGVEAICNKVNMGNEGGMFIIDGSDNIIYSSVSNIPYVDFFNKIKTSGKSYITVNNNRKSYLLNSTTIPRSNWTLVAVNSLNEINKNARHTRNNAFIMSIICSALAILVLTIFIKWFLKPLLSLVKLMQEIQNGNLTVKFDVTHNDEIGYIGSSFNNMVDKINNMLLENTKLVKEVYEAKYLQKEAQINTLFNQIRPHFIYNTLNMISMLIQCGRYEKAVDNINKLSSILRGMANLDKDVSVKYEIELLEAYLGIQASRYDGRLQYKIEIEESLYSYKIPALILQPAVENAVIHGCEAVRDKTLIRIYSMEDKTALLFIIEDNGVGMDAISLKELNDKINNNVITGGNILDSRNKSSGIGLVNINRRIKIRYGQDYGLKIDSNQGLGTKVTIMLPKIPQEGEDYNV